MTGLLVAGLLPSDPSGSPSAPPERGANPPAAHSETGSAGTQPEAIETSELAAIRDELAFERDARIALAEELDLIWAELAELSAVADGPIDPPQPAGRSQQPSKPMARIAQKWFDTASLLKAGIPEHDVERLRELYEAEQLDELYLRDAATREGWVSTPRYRKALQRLKQDLHAELGDEDYDRVKFASGKNNRVEVDDVLQNSAAATIGLRKGDIIVRYDGQLMLSPRDLRAATVRGAAAQTTAIDVLRGSETLRFYVPRGPLGARIGQTRRQPE